MRDERAFLFDILESAHLVKHYVLGVEKDAFERNLMLQDALLRRLTLIGEAAKQITPETRRLLPELPLREWAGLRDKVVHQYWRTNLNIIWETVNDDVQKLIDAITPLLPPEDAAEAEVRQDE